MSKKEPSKTLDKIKAKSQTITKTLAEILQKLIAFQKDVDERSKIQPVTPQEQKAMDAVNAKLGIGDKAGALALLDSYHAQGVVPDIRYYQIRNSIANIDYTPFF
jgi:hypothetical protein